MTQPAGPTLLGFDVMLVGTILVMVAAMATMLAIYAAITVKDPMARRVKALNHRREELKAGITVSARKRASLIRRNDTTDRMGKVLSGLKVLQDSQIREIEQRLADRAIEPQAVVALVKQEATSASVLSCRATISKLASAGSWGVVSIGGPLSSGHKKAARKAARGVGLSVGDGQAVRWILACGCSGCVTTLTSNRSISASSRPWGVWRKRRARYPKLSPLTARLRSSLAARPCGWSICATIRSPRVSSPMRSTQPMRRSGLCCQ